jgi:hypothetical protein
MGFFQVKEDFSAYISEVAFTLNALTHKLQSRFIKKSSGYPDDKKGVFLCALTP